MFRIGVDIGGTFTDFALHDGRGDRIAIHKRLTTPSDPSVAVLEGVKVLAAQNNVAIKDVVEIVHGTTLVTNAVIERKGAKTGMLVTSGFGDIMDMGFERRYDLFDLRIKYPPPLVRRALRIEVAERVRHDGSVETKLDEAGVRAAAKKFQSLGVEAVAVCFLHAYANPAHEVRAAEILAKAAPGLFVSGSADVFPNMREFERWTTTTVNAFTGPMFDRYLKRLEDNLRAAGFGGRLYIMGSSGGTLTTATARRFPVRALESGPAAGALMSAHHGRALKLPNLLSFDMGGTTAKGALVRDGEPVKKYAMEVARVHEFRRGSGLPVRIPVIDMIEIGAGGRARFQSAHGKAACRLRGQRAATRAHDVEPAMETRRAQVVLEPFQIAVEHRAGERVDRRRGPALELAHVRKHVRRAGDEQAGGGFRQDLGGASLVRGVGVGVQEADSHRLDAQGQELLRRGPDAGLVEFRRDAAIVAHTLGNLDAQRPAHQRWRIFDAQIEQVVAPLETHIHDVAEAGRDQHAGPGALALDDGVGDEGRAMHDLDHVCDVDVVLRGQRLDAVEHGHGWIGRRRQPLVDCDAGTAAVMQREVRERTADIDADPEHAILEPMSPCRPLRAENYLARGCGPSPWSRRTPVGLMSWHGRFAR